MDAECRALKWWIMKTEAGHFVFYRLIRSCVFCFSPLRRRGCRFPTALFGDALLAKKPPLKQSHDQRGSAVFFWNEVVTPHGSPGRKGFRRSPTQLSISQAWKVHQRPDAISLQLFTREQSQKNRFIPRVTYPASDIPLPCSGAENVRQKWEKRAKNEWQFTEL